MSERVRPGPLRWLAYAYGARLPRRCQEWVLHDVTSSTWVLRHVARTTAQLVPVLVVLYLLIPGQPWVRGLAALGGALIGCFYSFAYMYESAEHRAMKAGYPQGYAASVRAAAHAEEDQERAERYAQRWRTAE